MKIPDTNKIMSIAMIIGIVVALYIIYKILNAFGLLKTASDKRDDAAKAAAVSSLRVDQYFDPNFYADKNFNALDLDTAVKDAKDLRSAMAGIGTDEESIYTIFGGLPCKMAVSQVADCYKQQYGFPFYIMSDNLKTDLLNELTAEEVNTLMGIINNLPDN
jgi:hypothetical protein